MNCHKSVQHISLEICTQGILFYFLTSLQGENLVNKNDETHYFIYQTN